jgi:hypothetical protein
MTWTHHPWANGRNPRWRTYRAHQSFNEGEFSALLSKQDGKCAICLKGIEGIDYGGRIKAHIDHDHECCPDGKSCQNCRRGLLCSSCNTGLGFFRDSPEILQKAILYLESFPLVRNPAKR